MINTQFTLGVVVLYQFEPIAILVRVAETELSGQVGHAVLEVEPPGDLHGAGLAPTGDEELGKDQVAIVLLLEK